MVARMETIRSRKLYELVFTEYVGNKGDTRPCHDCASNNYDVAGTIVRRKMRYLFQPIA